MADYHVDVTFYPQALAAIGVSADARAYLQERIDTLADDLRRSAPVRSGAGRNSITGRVELDADGLVGTASWDDQHYYMGIQNSRTRWAEPTVERVRYV